MGIFLTDAMRKSLAPPPEPTPRPLSAPQLGATSSMEEMGQGRAELTRLRAGGQPAPEAAPYTVPGQSLRRVVRTLAHAVNPLEADTNTNSLLGTAYQGSNPVLQELARPSNYIGVGGGVRALARGALTGIGGRLAGEAAMGALPEDANPYLRGAVGIGAGLVGGAAGYGAASIAPRVGRSLTTGALSSERGSFALGPPGPPTPPRDPRLLPRGAGGVLDRTAAALPDAAAGLPGPSIAVRTTATEELLARAEKEIAAGGLTPVTHAELMDGLGRLVGAAPATEVEAAQAVSRRLQTELARESAPLAPGNLRGRVNEAGELLPPGDLPGAPPPPPPPPPGGPPLPLPPDVPPWKQRATNQIADILNVPRTTLSSIDLSASLRQGGYLAPSHPRAWADAMGAQLRALVSEDAARAVQREIAEAPLAQYRKTLYQSAWDGSDIAAREEQFMSKMAGKLPGVYQSQRAYSTMLNKLRANVFDSIVSGWDEAARTPKRLETLERWVEASTGRGSLPSFLKQHAPIVNATFFSPRFLVSIPQRYLIGITDPYIRKEIAKSAGTFYGTGLTLLGGLYAARQAGLLPGATIGTDYGSPDWGKVVVGSQHIDIWGGNQQFARMMLRTGEMAAKRAAGHPPPRGESELGVMTQFLRYKFGPVANLEEQLRTGRPAVGKKLPGAGETALRLFAPLALQDIYDAYQSGGWRAAALTAPLVELGVGAQTQQSAPGPTRRLPRLPSAPRRLPVHP